MKPLKKGLRIALGIIIPSVFVLLILFFHFFGSPPCIFHEVTGLYCPGCGIGRALKALMRFNVLDALQYNLLFTLSLPLVALFGVKWYLSLVSGRDIMPKIRVTDKGAWITLAVILSFFVLRNLPFPPFEYLSPDVFLER